MNGTVLTILCDGQVHRIFYRYYRHVCWGLEDFVPVISSITVIVSPLFPTIMPRSLLMCRRTSPQSPGWIWRYNRIVGYQDVSSRPNLHLQSGANGNSNHTGFPSAPAQCATAVSTLITRSNCSISKAVSPKSFNSPVHGFTGHARRTIHGVDFRTHLLQIEKAYPCEISERSIPPDGSERCRSFRWVGFPAHTRPTFSASPFSRTYCCHARDEFLST